MTYEAGVTMMGGWSGFHWVMFVVLAVLILYPSGRILGRIGFSPFWSVLAFIPLANIIGLWVLALGAWPRDKEKASCMAGKGSLREGQAVRPHVAVVMNCLLGKQNSPSR